MRPAKLDQLISALLLSGCFSMAFGEQPATMAEPYSSATWRSTLKPISGGGWIFLATSGDDSSVFYVSTKHVIRTGSTVAIWIRMELRDNLLATDVNRYYRSSAQRSAYDCSNLTSRAISNSAYELSNLSGEVVSSRVASELDKAMPVIPGTIGEILLTWACDHHGPKASPAK